MQHVTKEVAAAMNMRK